MRKRFRPQHNLGDRALRIRREKVHGLIHLPKGGLLGIHSFGRSLISAQNMIREEGDLPRAASSSLISGFRVAKPFNESTTSVAGSFNTCLAADAISIYLLVCNKSGDGKCGVPNILRMDKGGFTIQWQGLSPCILRQIPTLPRQWIR